MELHADIFGAVHFHKARRALPIVVNFRVCRVMTNDNPVLLRELDRPFEVVLRHDDGGWVIRRIQPHQLGFLGHVFWNCGEIGQKPIGLGERHDV